MNLVYTIGHSSHSIEVFLGLLRMHGITAIADVRSHPYSRRFTQYCRNVLKDALSKAGIHYVFLGKELGARSDNPACYRDGKVQYELLAQEPLFREGIARIRNGSASQCIALMCAEKDPLDCHRAILVARRLVGEGIQVVHILADGVLETQAELEKRMLTELKMSEVDMFRSREEIIADAYRIRGEQIAYKIVDQQEAQGRKLA